MCIESIAVIGATDLGCKLAGLSLRAGCRTIIEDISISALERAAAALQGQGTHTREWPPIPGRGSAAVNTVASAPELAHSVETAVRDADFIVEAVSDELEMKLELFTIFDKFAKPGAVFASTTAALSIAELAAMTFCPERCVGFRLQAGADGSDRVRLVATDITSCDALAACRDLARRMILPVDLVSDERTLPASGDSDSRA